jgi:hypothetical protein
MDVREHRRGNQKSSDTGNIGHTGHRTRLNKTQKPQHNTKTKKMINFA